MRFDASDRLYAALGQRVRRARQQAKLTQQELAERVGVSRTSITNIELGQQKFQVHVLWAIALAVSVPIEDLIPRLEQATALDIEGRVPQKLESDELEWVRRVISQSPKGQERVE